MNKKKSNSKDESEYVAVQVRVPKAVAEFFNAFSGFSVEAFCEKEVIVAAKQILENLSGASSYCVDSKAIVERYGLERFLDLKKA